MRTALAVDVRRTTVPLEDLLGRVADAGFGGVHVAGLDDDRLQPIAAALGSAGVAAVAVEVPYDLLQAERRRFARMLSTIGCPRVVLPGVHEAYFADATEARRMVTRLSALGGRLAADGRTLCYRTGTSEFEPMEGPHADPFELLVERTGDGLAFELDVGAAVAAERDPIDLLDRLGDRVPLVRLRDVDADGVPAELGEGVVDVDSVAATARETGVDWLVYDYHGPGRDGGR